MKVIPPGERQTCYDFRFEGRTPVGLAADFIEFWRKYAEIVLPANQAKGMKWDHLHVVLKGPDGRIEFWPEHTKHRDAVPTERPLVYWASIYIVPLEDFYLELQDHEFDSPKEKEEEMRWMEIVIAGAEAVHFAELAGFADTGVPVRFHVYEGEEPIWETIIGGPPDSQ